MLSLLRCLLLMIALGPACVRTRAPAPVVTDGGSGRDRVAPPSEVDRRLDAWLEAHAEGVEITIDSGALQVSCPVGVLCDENFDYWAVRGGDTPVYISFEASVLRSFDREGLQAALRYVSVGHAIDVGAQWQAVINPFYPFHTEDGGMTVERYAEGRIALTIVQDITHVYGQKIGDPGCHPPEDAGMPAGCEVRRVDLAIPAIIRIDLPIPSEALDCRAGQRSPACG